MKPKALIFTGYGIHCEEETSFAFHLVGFDTHIVHVNDVIEGYFSLGDYQVVAFPGGFSYGDDTGSGNAFALKVKGSLWEDLLHFVEHDHLVIGICNGFQILVNLGMFPVVSDHYGARDIALVHNESARYSDRWVDLQPICSSPWLKGLKDFSVPIAHGEGLFYSDPSVLEKLKQNNQIAFRYIRGEVSTYQHLPANPNGALDDIAGIIDKSGRVLGLMPHPERALFFTQLPQWPFLKEQYKREKREFPQFGPGLHLFQNAAKYFE